MKDLRVALLKFLKKTSSLLQGAFLIGLLLSPATLKAGGAIGVNIHGDPLQWDITQGLIYHPESGNLSPNLSQAESLALLDAAVATWDNIPGVQLSIAQGALLPPIDEDNFQQYLGVGTEACYPEFFAEATDPCVTPIVFDERGEIIARLFGQGSQYNILGFAGPDDILDGEGEDRRRLLYRGEALFNGACMPPALSGCQRTLSSEDMRSVMTHEMGHLLSLDHAQVHPGAYGVCSSTPEGCPQELAQAIPTMFPILVLGAETQELHADDIAIMRELYADPLNHGCSVEGRVYASDGLTEVRGVEVVAQDMRASRSDTNRIARVSGANAPKRHLTSRRQGNCVEDCGRYQLSALPPGASYQICVKKILPQFTGGSSIEPVDPPFQAFSNDCPQNLTVTCDCPSGGLCPSFSGMDIITDADPNSIDDGSGELDRLSLDDSNGGGGCSLIKVPPRPTYIWRSFRKAIRLSTL